MLPMAVAYCHVSLVCSQNEPRRLLKKLKRELSRKLTLNQLIGKSMRTKAKKEIQTQLAKTATKVERQPWVWMYANLLEDIKSISITRRRKERRK